MELRLGFSTCPNDTFIFYALVHGKVSDRGLRFVPVLKDVEELNHLALKGELDISKVSYHAVGYLLKEYCLLRSGGALGRGCGPLVVAKESVKMASLKGKRIAIPGRYTTAYLLLSLYEPALRENVVSMPFFRIMEAVRAGDADAGLIIHEGRFTYPLYGLKMIKDLGEWWEEETSLPIPLGGIVARRGLGGTLLRNVEEMIAESIRYAYEHPDEVAGYIKRHAQEMDDAVIRQHIDLYVNEFSMDLGLDGAKAVEYLIIKARDRGVLPEVRETLFCTRKIYTS